MQKIMEWIYSGIKFVYNTKSLLKMMIDGNGYDKGEIIKMNNEFVKNIKKAYITPFGIFINALTLL
ncbi:hypothetical protein BU594_13130, partial [Staphylococcus arlettae]